MDEQGNINRVIRLYTPDFKHTASISMFNGRPEISVFDNSIKSAPIIKVLFESTLVVQFIAIVSKIASDPSAKPIKLGIHPFDREQKLSIFKSSVEVGRNENGEIYFDIAGENHKDPLRFYTVTNRNYKINDGDVPQMSLTEAGAKTIIKVLEVLFQASFYAKDKPFTPNNNDTSDTGFAPKSVGDDIEF